MPHFFFDVRDGEKFTSDENGLDFPNIALARDQAARALAEMAKFALPGAVARELAIEVRDAASRPLLRTMLRYEAQPLR
jgi:hypothetical protein